MKVNAVFEGGGMKAMGLIGAVYAAEEQGLSFAGVAGTSSGAMVASLIAAGYDAESMKQIIKETTFAQFLQRSWLHRLNVVGTTVRLLIKKGLYAGDALQQWMEQKLAAKGVRYFSDLPANKLRIIASDITEGRLLVLPDDIAYYGIDPARMEIAAAVRMSTSIPYFFDPVVLRNVKTVKSPIYIVDGALLSNFPLWLFDRQYAKSTAKMVPTVGFQLVGKNTSSAKRITGPITMFQALFSTMMEAHDERYIEKRNFYRTIKIPTLGVQTTDFNLSKEKTMALFESGRRAGQEFFAEWSYSQYMAQFEQYVKAT